MRIRHLFRGCGILACSLALALPGAPGVQAASTPDVRTAAPASNVLLTEVHVAFCDYAHLAAAIGAATNVSIIFDCDGTIVLDSTIWVANGTTLFMDGNGHVVTLSGADQRRILVVNGPSAYVSLKGLKLAHGQMWDVRGTNGADGTGNPGANGDNASGGALLNLGTARIVSCEFSDNVALGADAGNGGSGVPGSTGMPGGTGGKGGDGGAGQGGAIFNGGRLDLIDTVFTDNYVSGGLPGAGGAGGAGGPGASPVSGDGGNGGPGGTGGEGGRGGSGTGGTIFNNGYLSMAGVVIHAGSLTTNGGGKGGKGGQGGSGGDSNDAYGGDGGKGGTGGAGGPTGSADGGAIFSNTWIQISDSTIDGIHVSGGYAGNGGDGGNGGSYGNGAAGDGGDGDGGDAGNGGYPGEVIGGVAWLTGAAQFGPGASVSVTNATQSISMGGQAGTPGSGAHPGAPGVSRANGTTQDPGVSTLVTITDAFDLVSAALPAGQTSLPYSATIGSVNGTAPLNWQVLGTLPAGLSIDPATGTISGTPTSPGPSSFKVWATDSSTNMQNSVVAFSIAVGATASTYEAITPARVLDSRPTGSGHYNMGLTGKFVAGTVRTFAVAGAHYVGGGSAIAVPSSAIAVTGNLTVTAASAPGLIALGPTMTPTGDTTTLNFSMITVSPAKSENRANNVTMGLFSDGTLSAVFRSTPGATTDLIFDVTGYFIPDNGGATYHPLAPGRVLDTRSGTGHIGLTGKFKNKIVRAISVAGVKALGWPSALVPSNATAVTGNVTVTNATSDGFVAVGPTMNSSPLTSTVNTRKGRNTANGVTVALSAGKLKAVWCGTAGSNADVIVDITGYFTADETGLKFYPISPFRILDSATNHGLTGPFATGTAQTLPVGGSGAIPVDAAGIAGNLTVVQPTSNGYAFIAPVISGPPASSTVNTNLSVSAANGFDVSLDGSGNVMLVWVGNLVGSTANLQLDINGYWK